MGYGDYCVLAMSVTAVYAGILEMFCISKESWEENRVISGLNGCLAGIMLAMYATGVF